MDTIESGKESKSSVYYLGIFRIQISYLFSVVLVYKIVLSRASSKALFLPTS